MKPEQVEEVKAKEEILHRYLDFLQEGIKVNVSLREQMALELSYKTLELIIAASIGILGGVGIAIVISNDINPISSTIFFIAVLLILFLVKLAFNLRRDILILNRDISADIANFGEKHYKKTVEDGTEMLSLDWPAFFERMNSIKKAEIHELGSIYDKMHDNDPEFQMRMNLVKGLFSGLLVLVATAIAIEIASPAISSLLEALKIILF